MRPISSRIFSPLLLLSSLGFAPFAPAAELPLPDRPHLVVEGRGEVEQVPDRVTLQLEVFATADSFSAAKREVDAIVAKAIEGAKQQGVDRDDIDASKVHASPQYEWNNQKREYKGEQVRRQLAITLNRPDNYNDLVEALLAAGVSRLQNVTFDFSNREALEAKALRKALDHARQQAQVIADQLNTELGAIFQVAPVTDGPVVHHLEMAAARSDTKSAPLELSKQRVQQQVRVVFLLPR